VFAVILLSLRNIVNKVRLLLSFINNKTYDNKLMTLILAFTL